MLVGSVVGGESILDRAAVALMVARPRGAPDVELPYPDQHTRERKHHAVRVTGSAGRPRGSDAHRCVGERPRALRVAVVHRDERWSTAIWSLAIGTSRVDRRIPCVDVDRRVTVISSRIAAVRVRGHATVCGCSIGVDRDYLSDTRGARHHGDKRRDRTPSPVGPCRVLAGAVRSVGTECSGHEARV